MVLGIGTVACAPEADPLDEARRSGLCEGKCDGLRADGALTVSKTWVPDGGFVRAIAGAGQTLVVVPSTGVSIQPSGAHELVRFADEGFYEIQARDGETIAGRVKVRVADDGPLVELDAAGSFQTLGAGPLSLGGIARDPLGTPLALTLDGQPVDTAGEAFTAEVTGRFGINPVEIVATDAAANRFVFTRSFLAAPSFGSAALPVAVRVSPAGLSTLVAGLTPLLPTLVKIPITTEPVKTYLGNDIYLDQALLPGQEGRPGSMALALSLGNGKLHATLTTTADVLAGGRIDWLVGGWSDYQALLSGLRVELDLRFVTGAGGALDVRAENVVVTIGDLSLSVEHLPDWLVGVFGGLIKGILADTVEEQIPPMIKVLLVALSGTVPVEVPIPGNPVAIDLTYGVKSLTATTTGLAIVLEARAHGAADPGQGAPLRHDGPLAAPTDAPFGVAVGYDLFNQVAYTLWKADAFAISLTEADLAAVLAEVPEIQLFHPTIDVQARLGLPAVAEPVGDALRVSIGEVRTDIFLATDLFQVSLKATVSASADVDVSVMNQTLHADLTVTEIHVDLERTAFAGLDPESVERFVEALAPVLVDTIEQRLGDLPLPAFDLAAAGLPGVTVSLQAATVRALGAGITVGAELQIQ